MAFFGLTALGPQNSFEEAAAHHRNLQIFEDQDFEDAWYKINGKDATFCDKSKIGVILRVLFHGPVPRNDIVPIEEGFASRDNGMDTITFNDYLKTMYALRKDAEEAGHAYDGKQKPETEFISSSTFRESLKKNAAMKIELNDKYTMPITAMQEVSYDISFVGRCLTVVFFHCCVLCSMVGTNPKL